LARNSGSNRLLSGIPAFLHKFEAFCEDLRLESDILMIRNFGCFGKGKRRTSLNRIKCWSRCAYRN